MFNLYEIANSVLFNLYKMEVYISYKLHEVTRKKQKKWILPQFQGLPSQKKPSMSIQIRILILSRTRYTKKIQVYVNKNNRGKG